MQFMFVALKVGWVCDQNLWYQFVKANTLEDLITYMKGGPNFILNFFWQIFSNVVHLFDFKNKIWL
jgi:hypothetical protein